MIYTLFVIFIVIASLLMIGIVLIQESKGGGLASNFSSSNAILGVRKTTDFVEKATWGLAITMVVLSIVCAHVAPVSSEGTSVMEKLRHEGRGLVCGRGQTGHAGGPHRLRGQVQRPGL